MATSALVTGKPPTGPTPADETPSVPVSQGGLARAAAHAVVGLPVPCVRAAVLVVLAAPLAVLAGVLVPGAWLVAPALGAALLFAIALDVWLAGSLAQLSLECPADMEVGVPTSLTVSLRLVRATARWGAAHCALALACDTRLAAGGRVDLALAPGDAGQWRGSAAIAPSARGTGALDAVWVCWRGPLGLGARQARVAIACTVRVWPDVSAIRSPAFQTFLRDADLGLIARRMRGEGMQFEALTDYAPGMERRRIDWKASARHVHLLAREYETERNTPVVFAFDCGQAMCEPVHGVSRLDRAISAALATAYVALRGGDRVALYGFAARPELVTPFVSGSSCFHRLQRAAAGLEYRAQESNFTLALASLDARLQRRSLLVVFCEFSDPAGADLMIESLSRLATRHAVLFVSFVDEELEALAGADPVDLDILARAVSADTLLHRRLEVHARLRQIGVDVIEAPYSRIGTRLIDAYLMAKRKGVTG